MGDSRKLINATGHKEHKKSLASSKTSDLRVEECKFDAPLNALWKSTSWQFTKTCHYRLSSIVTAVTNRNQQIQFIKSADGRQEADQTMKKHKKRKQILD